MPFFEPGIVLRVPLYITLGIVCEFLFTAVCDLVNPFFLKSWNVFAKERSAKAPLWRLPGRDPRAAGYSFLWMIPIYALLVFIEPASRALAPQTGSVPLPFYIRGVVYVIALWVVEYAGGWLIKKISGRCPWDYSASKFNFHGYVRWDFFPFWFVFMLLVEWMSGKFIALTPAISALIKNINN